MMPKRKVIGVTLQHLEAQLRVGEVLYVAIRQKSGENLMLVLTPEVYWNRVVHGEGADLMGFWAIRGREGEMSERPSDLWVYGTSPKTNRPVEDLVFSLILQGLCYADVF